VQEHKVCYFVTPVKGNITNAMDLMVVLGNTDYLVFDTSDTCESGIDYWPGIARYFYPFF
jgi:hypothetical protein